MPYASVAISNRYIQISQFQKHILIWDLPLFPREKLRTLSDFVAQITHVRHRLPALCPGAGERSKLPGGTSAPGGGNASVLTHVALVTKGEGMPNSWLPK